MGEMFTFFSARLTAVHHELKPGVALMKVTELLEDLLVVLLLADLQVCRIALHAPSHVVWQVLKRESGLLFCGSEVCSGVG